VVVIDGDADYRLLLTVALRGRPDLTLAGEATTVEEGARLVGQLAPTLVLLDVSRGNVDLAEAVTRLTDAAPGTSIVALSASDRTGPGALPAPGGLAGRLSKAVPPSRLASELLALSRPVVEKVLDRSRVDLPAELESARQARRFIEEALGAWDAMALADAARLLVSELVGNAVGHAQSTVELEAVLLEDRIRVEVSDDNDERLRRRASTDFDLSGRGIAIVEAMAQSWGVRDRGIGKTVWFELAR